jgi:uncharacterized repeat protein (TIGR01451 family)
MNKISRILLVAVIITCLFAGVAAACTIKVTDHSGNKIRNQYVTITHSNQYYSCTTDNEGMCEINDTVRDGDTGHYGTGYQYIPTCTANKVYLSITKSASPSTYSFVGDVINYTYVITNTGNVNLTRPFNVFDNKTTVTCPNAPTNLTPGKNITCTANYTVKTLDIKNGSITNSANATAYNKSKLVESKKVTATVTFKQIISLDLTKSASPSTYSSVGDVINYTYVITNTGNVNLTSPFKVFDNKTTVTCLNVPTNLIPGAIITCTSNYTVKASERFDHK